MPVYEFKCPECGVYSRRLGVEFWSLKEDRCDCGRGAPKIPSVTTFDLKGGGWYASGYSKGE